MLGNLVIMLSLIEYNDFSVLNVSNCGTRVTLNASLSCKLVNHEFAMSERVKINARSFYQNIIYIMI